MWKGPSSQVNTGHRNSGTPVDKIIVKGENFYPEGFIPISVYYREKINLDHLRASMLRSADRSFKRKKMKKGIHPKLNKLKVACSCGNEIETVSTSRDLKIEMCSACHPFYTGKTKVLNVQGRIESFNKKYQKFKDSQSK